MNNEKAIKILRKGYPDINRYAASELEDYEYDVEAYDDAVEYAISHLVADRWNVIETKEDNPKEEGFYLTTVETFSELEGKMKYTTAENYFTPDFGGQWVDCDDEEGLVVIAWKPLPKSYESENN